MDPFGIEVGVVDGDVPAARVGAQGCGGDGHELVPAEASGLRVVDRRKRLRRQDVEVEVEPPRIGKRRAGRRRDPGGIGRETLTVHERHPVTQRRDTLGAKELRVTRAEDLDVGRRDERKQGGELGRP